MWHRSSIAGSLSPASLILGPHATFHQHCLAFQQSEPEAPLYQASASDTQVTGQTDPRLLQEQLRFCGSVLKQLKRLKDARPFLSPVDPVKLKIPTYYDIVKQPMDLSTIELKWRTAQYPTPQEFVNDVKLMFANCYLYNGRASVTGQSGERLEGAFERLIEKMPLQGLLELNSPIDREGSSDSLNLASAAAPQSSASHPDLELKFCNDVLKELCKKTRATYNWPFLQPVDPDALGIPHYRTVVTHPMDLSTIRRKLETGSYADADAFAGDVRLMLRNCFVFNPVGHDIHTHGKKLEEVFERKWAAKDAIGIIQDKRARKKAKRKSMSHHHQQQHAQQPQHQYHAATVSPGPSASAAGPKRRKQMKAKETFHPYKRKAATAAPRGGRKGKAKGEEGMQPLSWAEKEELSELVGELTAEKIETVMDIIRAGSGLPETSDAGEIELDIEVLDLPTQRRLFNFVKGSVAASHSAHASQPPAAKPSKHLGFQ
ncbi:Bromodomain-containing protein [Fimicolochytrium jonesii]|uniref:Bromodomain-containing protein n=1 Tax=Fimicolochytrium jonesii TaxID=1396493 RepID=UPI0022FE718F|nr:Bromodomain-containing protein [Fimicolochytrium jonesii]KAI8823758.1 Bromodomain-containing protein [Fimicolochytrium jonesii]